MEKLTYDGDDGLTGNVTSVGALHSMTWDAFDQLRSCSRQIKRTGAPETTWYVYDSQGKRVRKVTEAASAEESAEPDKKLKDTVYLSGLQIYRRRGKDGATNIKDIHSSHMRGDKLIAIVEEFRHEPDAGSLLVRYQMTDKLELDDSGLVVTYEEHSPYGTETFTLRRSKAEAARKYRFAAYERDKERGLYYCNARYYAPWLGRWMSPDPIGTGDGLNMYCYVGNDPVNCVDPSGTNKLFKLGIQMARTVAMRSMPKYVHPGIAAARVRRQEEMPDSSALKNIPVEDKRSMFKITPHEEVRQMLESYKPASLRAQPGRFSSINSSPNEQRHEQKQGIRRLADENRDTDVQLSQKLKDGTENQMKEEVKKDMGISTLKTDISQFGNASIVKCTEYMINTTGGYAGKSLFETPAVRYLSRRWQVMLGIVLAYTVAKTTEYATNELREEIKEWEGENFNQEALGNAEKAMSLVVDVGTKGVYTVLSDFAREKGNQTGQELVRAAF
ncbi:hypothetical protein K505DRAFT_369058 [Melanomma pulvis-pyrius CBS 109.77]|uniref:RHS repeat-associated core domain-containing protein n=1 Tax=Melanomma pulvis-pyrius CBS 109.77 TaxID=1314802 RepID=A0A6A6WNB4_9PLEO|nr:hypothetical protein K505DRAFT_369058 [Melanomma pulvis-pyrius CBS 109.77]